MGKSLKECSCNNVIEKCCRDLVRSGSFRRANEQALVKLLSEGQVVSSDLHYLEILGHGSGGTVYRTFHQSSKIVMAVKVLALDVTLEEQKQIKSELDILHKVRTESLSTDNDSSFLALQCNSQYIIGFYGAFFNENRISICTEYMDGKFMHSCISNFSIHCCRRIT